MRNNFIPACLLLLLIFVPGCSNHYPGLPELPQKDWLNPDKKEAPHDSEKIAIYAPDKVLGMDDLVWLAIQDSPVLSRGTINLEIQEIQKRDAKWRYLPEMHITYTVSNNLTQYNKGNPYAGENYGETAYQLSFNGFFNNPVATYFSNKAQDELMQVAIVTQRKAIADVILNIARTLLQINLKEKTIALLEQALEQKRKKSDFSSGRQAKEANVFNSETYSEDEAAELELRLNETRTWLAVDRSHLKQLVGLDLNKALKVDAASVLALIDKFNPADLNWKKCWDDTEDRYLLHQQVRLENANIFLSWAQYVPNINIGVNENAPNGQSQPYDGQTDQFLHLTFDFPLLDWGHRWRMADLAAARKRQGQLDEIQRERAYGEQWLVQEQQLKLASARLERNRMAASNAAKRLQGMEIAYQHGTADMAAVSDASTNELERRINVLNAECELGNQKLSWMHMASRLALHYLGHAGYEKEK